MWRKRSKTWTEWSKSGYDRCVHRVPRTARGRATRARILRAATELVSQRGIAGTSLDDVRDLASASKSQLYLYFPDRDALMREVAGSTCDTVVESQAEILAGFDSIDGIKRYLGAIVSLQVQLERPTGCPIATLAGQLSADDEGARMILADGFDRWEAGLRDGLDAMASRGAFKPGVDPARIAQQTLALLQGGLVLARVRSDADQLRSAADGVIELVRGALAE